MEIRDAVIAEALTWQGTKFIHQASVKGAGVGCGTFLVKVYQSQNIPVPNINELGHFSCDWHCHTKEERYLDILLKYTHEIPYPPEPGDIALFKIGRVHSHSAIVIEWPKIIHVHWSIGVSIINANEDVALKNRPVIFLSPF